MGHFNLAQTLAALGENTEPALRAYLAADRGPAQSGSNLEVLLCLHYLQAPTLGQKMKVNASCQEARGMLSEVLRGRGAFADAIAFVLELEAEEADMKQTASPHLALQRGIALHQATSLPLPTFYSILVFNF